MFELNPPSELHLVLIAIWFFCAMAVQFKKRLFILFFVAAIMIPTTWLWPVHFPSGNAGLGVLLAILMSIAAMILGFLAGGAVRIIFSARWKSFASLFAAGVFSAIFVLWYQHVPNACLGNSLQVEAFGETLSLPPESRPRLETSTKVRIFGVSHRKSDYAVLCRKSRNGTRPVEVKEIWISPDRIHEALSSACQKSDFPAWCSGYVSEPFRYISRISITSNTDALIPLSAWKAPESPKLVKTGDPLEGSVCRQPSGNGNLECWAWLPFGEGGRLTIRSKYGDPVFFDMPFEEALSLIRKDSQKIMKFFSR